MADEKEERAREGGGTPSDRGGAHRSDLGTPPQAGAVPATGSEASVPNRREIPGGSFRPAHPPGALGPTTRDTRESGSRDANESGAGRTELAGQLQEKPNKPSD